MRNRLKKKMKHGVRMSDTVLFRRLKSLEESEAPCILGFGYEPMQSEKFFCLNCGHGHGTFIDRGAPHPEVWQYVECSRCGNKTQGADNSAWSIACYDARNEMPSDLTKSQYRPFVADWID